ncbi:MAG: alpha/beta fold hydrolase [Candidatus Saccharibacteria bacterium]
MKQAVLLHGTGGKPEGSWRPWLKAKLEAERYSVWVPELPDGENPKREVYNDFLLGSGRYFTDGIVVGHSSGAASVLNMLMDERCPKIKLGVMVSFWEYGVPPGRDEEHVRNLFPPNGFDYELIKSKAAKLAFLQSDNDTVAPLEQIENLAHKLNASFTVVHNGDHLGSPRTELPELWQIIEPNL